MDKSFIFLSMFLFILINNIYSIEDDEENPIYYVNFDLSDPDFKYKNSSEKIENIVTNQTSIRIPEFLLVKDGFYFIGQKILFMDMNQEIYLSWKKKILHFFLFLKIKVIEHILDSNIE